MPGSNLQIEYLICTLSFSANCRHRFRHQRCSPSTTITHLFVYAAQRDAELAAAQACEATRLHALPVGCARPLCRTTRTLAGDLQMGLTTMAVPELIRSESHAWSAHLGELQTAEGTVAHPRPGEVVVK